MSPAPLPVQKNRETVREPRDLRDFRPNDIRDNRQDYNQRGPIMDPKNDKKINIQIPQNTGRRETIIRNDNPIPNIRNDQKKPGGPGNRGRQG